MKAAWFSETGPAREVLRVGEMDRPEPAAGEVLVRIHASGVNPSDVKKRAGAQPPGFRDGFVIPHSDGAGVIEAVGAGVPEERIGTRVWVYQAQYQRHWGTAAEYVALAGLRAAPLPDNCPFEVGALAGIPMMTAHRCVFADGDVDGKSVLVTGASGRVGFYAAQWAKRAGAMVIGTAGSTHRLAEAQRTGADHILDYTRDDLTEAILDLTAGQGVDRIVDVEMGQNIRTSAEVLKVGGVVSTYSSSRAMNPEIPFYPLMFKNITLQMVLVYNMAEGAKTQARKDIHEALSEDALVHRIAKTFPLEETAAAHEAIEGGGADGGVVVAVP